MTTALLTLAVIATYVVLLFVVAHLSVRGGDNVKFFTGGRNQKWWVVALAMVGAPMTGITFISVPGMVGVSSFSYLQMALGFIVGSILIAYLLIPLYYRHNVTSLYEYLDGRFGVRSHSAGAWLFLVSKVLGASLRAFVVCVVIQQLLCSVLGIPFWATATIFMALAWLYTYRGGVGAVVWTDALKTICMVSCVVLCALFLLRELGLPLGEAVSQVSANNLTKIFYLSDIDTSLHFAKMFLSGVFMIVAMTGLDQDMMQRALSSRSQHSAQRNMVVASLLQTVVIAMLLGLGALLYLYLAKSALSVAKPDEAFAFVATREGMPIVVSILLVLGVVSASFSSTGGALTSLTTSFAVDILRNKGISDSARKWLHGGVATILLLLILAFEEWSTASSIELFYRLASYTYGPLLGLFAFGVLTKREVCDRVVPAVVVVAPLLCALLDIFSQEWFGGYKFGFEILLLNAAFTMFGLQLFSHKPKKKSTITLRYAREEDAPIVALAVAIAIDDEEALHDYCGESPLSVLTEIARAEATQYSWRFAVVAECDGEPVGAVVGYDGARLKELREGTFAVLRRLVGRVPNIEDETEAGEYYLDSVAVLPEFRGRGIGSALVEAFCERAFIEGAERVGLIVEEENTKAERVYQSLGFERVGERLFFGHRMHHLQKSKQ